MPPKRKVVLQPNEASSGTSMKSQSVEKGVTQTHQKRARHHEDEHDVDYGEENQTSQSQAVEQVVSETQPDQPIPVSPEAEERLRISKALESWCNNNISKDSDDGDVAERVAALAEVGQLLVFDMEKYPNAETMRVELQDIGSIIGGDVVVTRFINFILSLQNQLKKTRAQAERQMRQQQMMHQAHFPPSMGHGFQQFPAGMMPMMMHPGGQPMFVPGGPGMFMGPHGFPIPAPAGSGSSRGNMTLNATGEMTAVEKQREKERKRKEILAECTEHLKALLERVTKTTDAAEKSKIYELIDKVKKRIESLKEVTPPQQTARAPVPKGPVRGYYGNQYINPKLLEQQQQQQHQSNSGIHPEQ